MQRLAVIGLGRYGMRLAWELGRQGAEVIAIDTAQERVEAVQEGVSLAVRMDARDEKALVAQGVDKADAAVIAIGEAFEASVLATAALKRIGVKRVIARAGSDEQARILTLVGADEVIRPLHESANRLAQKLASRNLVDYVELAEGHSVIQLKAPRKFQNQHLGDLELRRKYEVNVVAIKKKIREKGPDGVEKESERIIVVPKPTDVIENDDVLVIVGSDENLAKLPAD
ncbi:MAG: TrkA family potassium uptake protein [Planctomycetota bacterium]